MRMNWKLISRLLIVPIVLLVGAGCRLTNNSFVTDQPATPVVEIGYVIEVVSDTDSLSTATPTSFARLTVKAIRSVIWKYPDDGTRITLKTNLGNFQSQSGPQTLELRLTNGVATTVFFGGEEAGIALITATIGEYFGTKQIEIVLPSE